MRTVRTERLRRLAGELAAGALSAAASGEALIVGHGSGSFGHPEAQAAGLAGGAGGPGLEPVEDRLGIARTQAAAHELHRIVVRTLLEAGVPAWSQAPSSFLLAAGGRPRGVAPAPLAAALRRGMTPVTMGDVAMDDERCASIVSTESVFEFLAAAMPDVGFVVCRAVWLGVTDGILDLAGRRLPRIDSLTLPMARAAAGDSAALDVTGGMEHRLTAAWRLARRGVESLIIDGRRPGLLEAVLCNPTPPSDAGTLVPAADPRGEGTD